MYIAFSLNKNMILLGFDWLIFSKNVWLVPGPNTPCVTKNIQKVTTSMSGGGAGELLGAGRKRAASTDLEAVVASAVEGADVSLVPQGDADAIAALATDVVAVEGDDDQAVQTSTSAAEEALAGVVGVPDASMFDKYTPELVRWLDECRAANGGGDATHDDVFFFFETTYPEVLDHLPQLFHWITVFMEHVTPAADASPSSMFLAAPEAQEAGAPDAEKPIPSWVPDAVLRLEATGDLATIATESGLKSPVTLLYWKNEHAKRELQREHDSHRALDDVVALAVVETEAEAVADATDAVGDAIGDIGRHRTAFMREDELSEWLLSHQYDQLTRQDVINHIMETYPAFAATKSPAALKVWTSRFLKRHLASTTAGGSKSNGTSKSSSSKASRGSKASDVATSDGSEASAPSPSGTAKPGTDATVQDAGLPETALDQTVASASTATTAASVKGSAIETTGTVEEARPAARKRRGACTGGYMLHSNEFKLNALRKLDEGKSVSEVAQELGLKSQNSLTYWNSIRDKLVTSEKKRYRLAGGGRRSSCTFEGELLMWVSERHQKGLGTWLGLFSAASIVPGWG